MFSPFTLALKTLLSPDIFLYIPAESGTTVEFISGLILKLNPDDT